MYAKTNRNIKNIGKTIWIADYGAFPCWTVCLALQELSATATTATDTANPALTAGMVTRTQNARQMTPKLAPRHHGHSNDCYNLSAQLLRQLRLGVCYRNHDHTHIGSRTVEVSRLPILRNGCLVKACNGMSAKGLLFTRCWHAPKLARKSPTRPW